MAFAVVHCWEKVEEGACIVLVGTFHGNRNNIQGPYPDQCTGEAAEATALVSIPWNEQNAEEGTDSSCLDRFDLAAGQNNKDGTDSSRLDQFDLAAGQNNMEGTDSSFLNQFDLDAVQNNKECAGGMKSQAFHLYQKEADNVLDY